tara:strand:+ start:1135 stop:2799 length:1665 start_codon:yes stop_codon:yes gene_type:complete
MQWSLEDIYKKQVRGNIPPRRHLRVLGEKATSSTNNFIKLDDIDNSEWDAFIRMNSKLEAKLLGQNYEDDEDTGEQAPQEDGNLQRPAGSRWAAGTGRGGQYGSERDPVIGDSIVDCKRGQECLTQVNNIGQQLLDEGRYEEFNEWWRGNLGFLLPGLIEPILEKKGWDEHIPKYARELKDRILKFINFDQSNYNNIVEFLKDESKHLVFPLEAEGNLKTVIANGLKERNLGIDEEMITSLMQHKTQDAKTRGIGMGELAMSLFFGNIEAAKGAGDLAMADDPEATLPDFQVKLKDGAGSGEFELKGHGASLGETPDKKGNFDYKKLGISEKDAKSDFLGAIVDKYNSTDEKEKGKFKELFWNVLTDPLGPDLADKKAAGEEKRGGNAGMVKEMYDKIDLGDAQSINTIIGLMNFVRYASREGFDNFALHDYGQISKGGLLKSGDPAAGTPLNSGAYVYVSGTPIQMANKLAARENVGFGKIKWNEGRPRIGLPARGKFIPAKKGTRRRPRASQPYGVLVKGKEEAPQESEERRFNYSQVSDEQLARHIDELSR